MKNKPVAVIGTANVGHRSIPRNTGTIAVMMTPKEASMEEVRRKVEEQVRKDCIHTRALEAYKDIKI